MLKCSYSLKFGEATKFNIRFTPCKNTYRSVEYFLITHCVIDILHKIPANLKKREYGKVGNHRRN